MGPGYLDRPFMYLMAATGLSSTAGNFIETRPESSTSKIAGKILQQPAFSLFTMSIVSGFYYRNEITILSGCIGLIAPLITHGMQKIANIANLPKLEKFFSTLDKVLSIAAKVMSCGAMIIGYNLSASLSSPLILLFIGLFALNAVLYTKQLMPYFQNSKAQVNS